MTAMSHTKPEDRMHANRIRRVPAVDETKKKRVDETRNKKGERPRNQKARSERAAGTIGPSDSVGGHTERTVGPLSQGRSQAPPRSDVHAHSHVAARHLDVRRRRVETCLPAHDLVRARVEGQELHLVREGADELVP
jgi:hypothetical protein